MTRPGSRKQGAWAALLTFAVVCLCGALAGEAAGERTQDGNLIASLDGGLSPLKLPRHRLAPVALHLEGGLQTEDGSTLPRVTGLELGLPGQGALDTKGLPTCPPDRVRNATPEAAAKVCGPALVGRGHLRAEILITSQPPFTIDSNLLAFNSRIGGRRAVLLHAFAPRPPTVVVLPFIIHLRRGPFGTVLTADLPPSLGPWPHFTHFEVTLFRRFRYQGHLDSYIKASCPAPQNLTAVVFSFARATYFLEGGGQISTTIPRTCRAA